MVSAIKSHKHFSLEVLDLNTHVDVITKATVQNEDHTPTLSVCAEQLRLLIVMHFRIGREHFTLKELALHIFIFISLEDVGNVKGKVQ